MPRNKNEQLKAELNNKLIQQAQIEEQLPEEDAANSMEQESSQYSSQDDDGVLLTDKVEEKLLDLVAQLRNKNPAIYDIQKPVFSQEDFNLPKQPSKKKEEKLTYKGMVLNEYNMKQKKSQQSSSQNNEEEQSQEQTVNKLKEKFKKKLMQKKENENQQQEMFKVKKGTVSLKNNATLSSKAQKLAENIFSQEKNMDDTDKFLREYILNKKWVTSKYNLEPNEQQKMIDEEDEERSLQMDQYQMEYNFRFEQPDGKKLIQHSRNVPESVRQKPQSRKQKRKLLQKKKKQEQQKLREQAEKKKQQMKKTILSKLQQQNNENAADRMDQQNNEEDIDHDWFFCDDCAKALAENQLHYVCSQCEDYMLCEQCFDIIIHKHQMNKSVIPKGFGPPPAQVTTKILTNLKPCRNCHRRIPKNLKRYQYTDRSYITTALCETCYDQSNLETKKKFKFVQPSEINYEQMLDKNPERIKELTTQKDIQQLVDEYMRTDFEDVLAGGLKAKFRYMSVKPQDYGLSDEQILFGDDKQLNKYVSIKKLAPYQDQDRPMKLRNSMYNKKIKPIQKSAQQNKNILSKSGVKGASSLRSLQKFRTRAQILKKRRQNIRKKLKIVNLTKKQDQKQYFLPKSRLESYGLTFGNNQQK